jgi:hypothetical protein
MDKVDVDFTITYKQQVKYYRYYVCNLVLGVSCCIMIHLYSDEQLVKQVERQLTQEEYALWGLDDTYIMDLAAAEVEKLKV